MDMITTLAAEVLPVFEEWLRRTVRDEVTNALQADRNAARPEKMLTRDEVCAILRISKPTLWAMTKEGKISCVRNGRRVLYRESSIKNYMEEG